MRRSKVSQPNCASVPGAAIGDGPALFINITDPFYRKLLTKDPTLTPYTHFTASGTGGEMKIAVVKGKIAQFGKASVDAPRYIVQPPVGYFARGDAVGFIGSYAFKTLARVHSLTTPKRRLIPGGHTVCFKSLAYQCEPDRFASLDLAAKDGGE